MATKPTSLTISLRDPGMTSMHRAGLAGLAMTLDLMDPPNDPQGMSWSVSEDSVSLSAGSFEDLSKLISYIFREGLKIDANGIIDFVGLKSRYGSLSNETRLEMQNALLGTFLQHGKSRKLLKIERFLILDPDQNNRPDTYRPLESFNHQGLAKDVIDAINTDTFTPTVGWVFPGAVEKHPSQPWSRLEASPHELFTLAFAPIGCIAFVVRDKRYGQKSSFALLVPHVTNLKKYISLRQRSTFLHARELTVASASDAALRLALFNDLGIMQSKSNAPKNMRALFCTGITFGTQIWSKQQKTRSAVIEIYDPDELTIYNYRALVGIEEFIVKRLESKGSGTWVKTSAARSAIAESLAQGQPWWQGVVDSYRTNANFREGINFERGGLHKMTKEARWNHESEQLFVETCHEAMKVLYASIAKQSREQNTDFGNKAKSELTKIRSSLLRAKNADSCRDTIIQFWSKASRDKLRFNNVLRRKQPHNETSTQPVWSLLLPLLDDSNWKKARDLTLLALISYASDRPEEQVEDHLPDTEA